MDCDCPKFRELLEATREVEAQRDDLFTENKRLRSALITAAQWMPSPGSEYDDDAKADVRQVQEALGWKLRETSG